MAEAPALERAAEHAARATPPALARRVRGLSDRAIAWLFIGPTIVLLLAINIFPLIWTINLSFTNFKANRAGRGLEYIGLQNYRRVLTDPRHLAQHAGDGALPVLDAVLPGADRLRAGLADQPQLPRQRLLDHDHRAADDAVAGGGRELLDLPLPAADRPLQPRGGLSSPAPIRPRSR